eukprot:3788102-Rhodomonas_salina.2
MSSVTPPNCLPRSLDVSPASVESPDHPTHHIAHGSYWIGKGHLPGEDVEASVRALLHADDLQRRVVEALGKGNAECEPLRKVDPVLCKLQAPILSEVVYGGRHGGREGDQR